MTFDFPWVLFFLILPVIFFLWEWRKDAKSFGTGAENCYLHRRHSRAVRASAGSEQFQDRDHRSGRYIRKYLGRRSAERIEDRQRD